MPIKTNKPCPINNLLQQHTSIITLLPKNTEKHLFLIHDMRGTVFCFMPLTKHFAIKRSVYDIQTIQTKESYLSVRTSLGTTTTIEMPKQLEKQKGRIILLGLLDGQTYYPNILHGKNIRNQHDPSIIKHQEILFDTKEILDIFNAIWSPYTHWEKHFSHPIGICIIPEDYNTMYQEPNIQILSQKINQYLDEIDDL